MKKRKHPSLSAGLALAASAILAGSGCDGGFGKTYTISFDANGAVSGSVPEPIPGCRAGQTIALPDNAGGLARKAKTFSGWLVAADGTGPAYRPGASFAVRESDQTLYAGWLGWTSLLGFEWGSVRARGMVSGTDGSLYVVGYATGGYLDGELDGQPRLGDMDAVIAKYGPDGERIWTRLLGISGDYETSAYGIAVDGAGGLYITGATDGPLDGQTPPGDPDCAFLSKFGADGSKLWTRLLSSSGAAAFAGGLSVAADDAGTVYVSGFANGTLEGQSGPPSEASFVAAYAADGTRLRTVRYGGSPGRACVVKIDAEGNCLVGGWDLDMDNRKKGTIRKIDPAGIELWSTSLGADLADTLCLDLALMPSGDLVASGHTTGGFDGTPVSGYGAGFVARYGSDGARKWTALIDESAASIAVDGLGVDESGRIFAAGSTDAPLGGIALTGDCNLFLRVLGPSGNILSTRLMGAPDHALNGVGGLRVDSDGTCFVSGWTNGALDYRSEIGLEDLFVTSSLSP